MGMGTSSTMDPTRTSSTNIPICNSFSLIGRSIMTPLEFFIEEGYPEEIAEELAKFLEE